MNRLQAQIARPAGLAGLVALAWFVLCWPWLVEGRVIPWDSKNHFYPVLRFLADSFQRGESPFWNPYHFAGHPLLADPQSFLFAPGILALAALDPAPSMRAFDAVVLAHLLAGGLAIAAWARGEKWHAAAAISAAAIFMMGGTVAARLQHTSMILSVSGFAIALLCLKLTLDRKSWRWAAAFGLAAALMAVNRDQVAFLGCFALLAYAGVRAIGAPDKRAVLTGDLPRLVLAGAIILALLAVPVLLTAQLAVLSNRPATPFDVAARGSLSPVNFLLMIFPDLFRSLSSLSYWGPGGEGWRPFDYTDRAINYLYIGALPALLLAWHGILGGRLFARGQRFALGLTVLSLLYGVGMYTPVFGLAFDVVPGVALYRRPADALFLAMPGLALLCGYLVHRWLADGAPRIGPWRAAIGFAAAAAAIGIALHIAARHGEFAQGSRAILAGTALLAAALALALLLDRRKRPRLAALAIPAFIVLDLAAISTGRVINGHDPATIPLFHRRDGDDLARLVRPLIERRDAAGAAYRFDIAGVLGEWQNAAMTMRLHAANGTNPLRLRYYEMFTGAGELATEPWRPFSPWMPGYDTALARLSGIKYALLWNSLDTYDPSHLPQSWRVLGVAGRITVYELPEPLPRAFFVAEAVVVPLEALVAAQAWPKVDPARIVILHEPPAAPARAGAAGTVRIERYGHAELRIKGRFDGDGFLVLNDPYYPGWRATVSGRDTPVLRANGTFRAIAVPAGEHEIVFRYEPLRGAALRRALSDVLGARAAPLPLRY